MNKRLIIGISVIVPLIGLSYYLVQAKYSGTANEMMTYQEPSPESTSMGDGAAHIDHSTPGAAERAFLEHMIPHHTEAVITSRIILEKSSNESVKELASAIITAQELEIATMKSWYANWYKTPYTESAYTPMMRDLTSLSGAELDRAYLEDMIEHHMTALEKAQSVAPQATHQETIDLAKVIAETQSAEIITMRTLLKQM